MICLMIQIVQKQRLNYKSTENKKKRGLEFKEQLTEEKIGLTWLQTIQISCLVIIF